MTAQEAQGCLAMSAELGTSAPARDTEPANMRLRRVRDVHDRTLEAHDSITGRGLATGDDTNA